ncbi:MAG: phosphoribosyltransferase domain-containing protein [Myxococcaceae bacterium]|jgi:hypothetical protein|nr:phosphoribosyltransferase domain-containing protein [Myxococcaceae bacterium]
MARVTAKKAKGAAKRATKGPARAAAERDEYGAAGGMPFAKQAVVGDRSHTRQKVEELTWTGFDREVQRLAKLAVSFRPEAVVGIAHGGVFVGGAVASALKADFFPVRLTRRSRDSETRSASGVMDDMPKGLAGKRVLVVDDICSSGDSLELASRLAKAVGATKVKTAALVNRPHGDSPDYAALTTDTFFVFPWDYQAVVEDERFDQRRPTKKAARGKGRKSRGAGGGAVGGDDVVLGV